ncbi:MAG: serpin family protein [Chloroflexi bacterium]|jgi:serpin B|nr:serpin family protein [Chloroflexota bacterium]
MRIWLILLTVSVLMTGCMPSSQAVKAEVAQADVPRETTPDVSEEQMAALVEGNTAFAADLYQELRGTDGNLFFSPYSISTALAMTYAGARGETETQMAETLHFTLSQEELHPAFNALDMALEPGEDVTDEEFILHIANSLWAEKEYDFREAFLELLARHYGAGLRLVSFKTAPEDARQAINEWVSDQTEEKIQDLIPKGGVTDLTRLVLANAIYFNAKWTHPFPKENTQDGAFTLLDGSEVEAPMMAWNKPQMIPHAQGANYQAIELPYRGGEASMVIIVPDAGEFEAFEQGLSGEQLESILSEMETRGVALTMPKFEYKSSFSLADTLAEMGMPDAMDEERADFSGMDGTRRLLITDVFHKAFVAVDEEGTEAAAATAVVVGIESMPVTDVELTVDRPFIYLIRDTRTGSVLFLGRVMHPAD